MTASAPSPAAVPPGVVRDGDRFTLPYGAPLHVMVWFAVALPTAIAIAMAILVPQDEPDAPIVPIVLSMLAAGAVPLALWWFTVRGVQYVIDAEGITKTRWRRATVRWDAVTDIRPWGRQIIIQAPGGVVFGAGSKPGKELRLPAVYLQVHGAELLRFLRERWAAGRRSRAG